MTEIPRAVHDLDLDTDTIVVVSPHGAERGIYAEVRGDLDMFGKPGVAVSPERSEDLAGDLADAWDAPELDAFLDHGIVTPLALGLARAMPLVAVSVSETKDGVALADAIQVVAERSTDRIAVVASAHLGAALTPRAPIPQRDDAVTLEDAVLDAITRDVGVLLERADDLAIVGGSCAAGPLATFGHAFAGGAADVIAYSREFGVGYLVAHVDA